MVFAVPVQLSIISVLPPGLKLAKLSVPTVPVPKSICDPLAVKVRAPTPTAAVLPSLKFPFANVPPAKVIDALLLIWLLAPSNTVPPELTVTDPVDPSAPEPLAARTNVPALTVVLPVNVFAPDRVQVPLPDFVSVPEPVPIMLEILPLPEPVRVRLSPAPVIVPVWAILSVPLS